MRGRILLCFLAALLLAPLPAQDTFTGVERVVAVGDVHGGFEEMVEILRGAGVINKKNKWSGGRTHLVQTGDVVDRGPESRKVMDLLKDLEKQAKKAGGMVHPLFGNHEAMNIYGDLRYVSAEEYESYKRGNSREIRDAYYQQYVDEVKKQPEPPVIDEAFRKTWDDEHPLGWVEHRYSFGPNGDYGRWLLDHNTVIRINDTVFLHGGISPKYAATTREVFNETIRAEMKDFTKIPGGMAIDELGPLWYRGLATGLEAELAEHVDAVLNLHGVKRIVIGHTPTVGAVLPRFGGKVIMIDVGLSKYYGGHLACLIIEKGQFLTWNKGKILKLPVDGSDISSYLMEVGIDPNKLLGKQDP